ncbi:MAG: hypothetical protein O9262_01835 [Cyclobacteriaceae bacterium]|nr:hypothetical protein [Cyclobacteriaceae bacterium]
MKFLVQLLFIVAGSFLIQLFLPWWSIAIVAFAGGFLFKSSQNFLAGFLSLALLWGLYAFWIDLGGAAPLADRVAGISSISKPLLFVLTAVVGGLVGGFAALSGSILKKDKRKSLYY